MAKVKNSNKKNVVAVFEDPRPGSNTLYFCGDGHNKATLAPNFDQYLLMNPTEPGFTQYGRNNTTVDEYSAGAPGYSMALTKQTTSVCHVTDTGNHVNTNIDPSWGLSMNPAYPHSVVKHWTDGQAEMVTYDAASGSAYHLNVYWTIDTSKELSETNPTSTTNQSGYDGRYGSYYPTRGWFYRDPNTDMISGLYHATYGYSAGNKVDFAPTLGIQRLNKFPTYASRQRISDKQYYGAQFVGPSAVDGKPIYLFNDRRSDHNQIIYRHNTSDNTETTLHTFNTVPAANGSNYGGDRDEASGIRGQVKMSSQIFVDPTSAGNECWYTPYFDTSNNYFPFFYQWDKATDVFTRNEDVTVSGDLSSIHLNNLHGIQGSDSGFKSMIYNETFEFSGTRYLSVFPLDGGYEVNDGQASARTIVTYSIDAADPKALTHHSVVTVPATIRNIVWLNDDRTQFGAICENSFHMYYFNATDGFVKTATLPYQFWAVGRDANDRIWANAYNSGGYCDIHLITPTIPVSIVITPDQATYDFQGTPITSGITINAFNSEGNRIATSVDLVIEGSTMTFADDTTTATVATSDTADTAVAIKITGAGFSNIVASVTV